MKHDRKMTSDQHPDGPTDTLTYKEFRSGEKDKQEGRKGRLEQLKGAQKTLFGAKIDEILQMRKKSTLNHLKNDKSVKKMKMKSSVE